MSYSIVSNAFFDKQLKRLVKKYPSFKSEFAAELAELTVNPLRGTPLGHHCYKVRIAIASKNAGKSGGARFITYVQVINTTIYLISIYDKGEQDTLSDKEIKEMIKHMPK